jgi:imidazolonepropionase-like amidohydrolase
VGFLFRRTLSISQQLTGRLQHAGVSLMLGTDTFGFPFCIAGKSAHDEMDLMQASGLTPFQALQSATINPAKFFGEEHELGTVTVGKRADLLLVKDNPLKDLETTRKPDGVMLRGVWLPAQQLQQMLEQLATLDSRTPKARTWNCRSLLPDELPDHSPVRT